MLDRRSMSVAAIGLLAIGVLFLMPGRADAGGGSSAVVTIEIQNFAFQPATITVHPGETIEWKNEDAAPHTATADAPKPGFDSGVIQSGAAWRYEARQKGTYNYICTIHPYMKGTLIVQ
jgi:plastocyanin